MITKIIEKAVASCLAVVLVSGSLLDYKEEKDPVLAADNTFDTIANPSGVHIDLFDYSLYYVGSDGQLHETEEMEPGYASGRGDMTYTYNATSGINFAGTDANGRAYCHLLRFMQASKVGDAQNKNLLSRGYVNSLLGPDGYPVTADRIYNSSNVYGRYTTNYGGMLENATTAGFTRPETGTTPWKYVIDANYIDGFTGPGAVYVTPEGYDRSTGLTNALFYSVDGGYTQGQVTMYSPAFPATLKNESLNYLFDPDIDHAGKTSYEDVNELFLVDEDGYYYFDSSEERAVYNEGTNQFDIYGYSSTNTKGKGFFPFDENEMDIVNKYDHYLGMHMSIEDFSIPADRMVVNSAGEENEMVFSFAGDDDVWIFIDGVLISDLGGIHGRQMTSINFTTGEISCDKNYGSMQGTSINGNSYTLKDVFTALGVEDREEWDGENFSAGSYHTLDFFYLERGNNNSNLYLKFNLVSTYDFTGHKSFIGDSLQENEFNYILRGYQDGEGNDAVMPVAQPDPGVYWSGVSTGADDLGEYEELTVGNSLDGNINFGSFDRTEAALLLGRTFKYTVREQIPEGAVENIDGTFSYSDPATGRTTLYDGRVYYFTGYLFSDGDEIWLSKKYYTDETYTEIDNDVSFINFENKADVASAQLSVSKALEGREWLPDETFEFTLYDSSNTALDTVEIGENGTVSFRGLTFEETGTYTYTISETTDLPDYMEKTEDITATVTVSRNPDTGYLETSVSYTNDDLIINSYEATGTATISVTKVVDGRPWTSGDSFEFELLNSNGVVIDTKTAASGTQTVNFAAITYDETDIGKTYTYTISEKTELPSYMSCSGDVTVTVVVNDNGDGTLDTDVTYTNNGKITNTYTPAPVTASIMVNKTVDGFVEGADNTFTMVLSDSEGTELMSKDLTTTDGSGSAEFGPLTYDRVGVYEYTVTETPGNVAGYDYDSNTYNVVVTVTDDLEGHLVASVAYAGSSTEVNVVNTFTEESIDVTLSVSKTITDTSGSASDGVFTFELLNADGDVIQTVEAATDALTGSVDFEALTFERAGDYKYTVRESAGTVNGMEYDDREYSVVIRVTDNIEEAKLEASVEIDGDEDTEITFTNVYRPAVATAVIEVTKVIDDQSGGGAWDTDFEFVLKDPDGETIGTASVTGEGTASFDPIEYTQVGTYDYVITETPGDAAGYSYDGGEYPVKVTVTDEDGALVASISYGTAPSLSITNSYDPEDAVVNISARKVIDDLSGSDPQGSFTFELVDGEGQVVETASIEGAGIIAFDPLTYDQIGTYEYTLREAAGAADGFDYDTSNFDVTVTVTDDGRGILQGSVSYGNGEAVFTNQYKADSAQLTLSVNKTIDGNDAPSEVFNFDLLDADGNVIQTKSVTGEGNVSFDDLTFSRVGTWTYFVIESEGDAEAFTYDGSRYEITVTVSDNGGKLVAAYTLNKLSEDGTSEDASEIGFVNIYSPTPTPASVPTEAPAEPTATPISESTATPTPTPTTAPKTEGGSSKPDEETTAVATTGENRGLTGRVALTVAITGTVIALVGLSPDRKKRKHFNR